MRIVLLGPPGSGKGTQAKYIVEKFDIAHISTGEIFRQNIKDKTPLGLKAKEYIDKGLLVPDDMTIAIFKARIKQDDCKNGFLVDGFPRTVAQADALLKELDLADAAIDHVINIAVNLDKLIARLTGRRVCTHCNMNYNILLNPPKIEGICDDCGGTLMQREDDSIQTVNNRLSVYANQTEPLIEYYEKLNLLRNINGEQNIEMVFNDICNMLGA